MKYDNEEAVKEDVNERFLLCAGCGTVYIYIVTHVYRQHNVLRSYNTVCTSNTFRLACLSMQMRKFNEKCRTVASEKQQTDT